jgi:hypothetical protein
LSLASFRDFELFVSSEDFSSKYVLIPSKSAVEDFSSTAGVEAAAGAQALTSRKRIGVIKKIVLFRTIMVLLRMDVWAEDDNSDSNYLA